MKTIIKYFDKDGNETVADKAVKAHKIVLDDSGRVTEDSILEAKKP